MWILRYLKKLLTEDLYSDVDIPGWLVSHMLIGQLHPLINGRSQAIVLSLKELYVMKKQEVKCGVTIKCRVKILCNDKRNL